MGVVARKSGVITNRDAAPRVINNPGALAGTIKGVAGTLESVSGDSIGSTYVIGQLPSNAVMHMLRLYSDDIGTTTVADVGLYRSTTDGGAVVDADFFASAVVLNAGALNGTDILHEAATAYDIDKVEKRLWEALGLSADPNVMYDLVLTLTAASDGAGTISLRAQYAI